MFPFASVCPRVIPNIEMGKAGGRKKIFHTRVRDYGTKIESHLLVPSMDSVFEEIIFKKVAFAS